MGGAPPRSNDVVDDRVDRLDTHLQDVEHRLRTWQLEEERIRGLEKNLLDASSRRIHDFERRLEHEWIALRQLHEEPLKTLEQRTSIITESSLKVVAEALALLRSRLPPETHVSAPDEHAQPAPYATAWHPRKTMFVLIAALAALTAFSAHTRWRLGTEVRETAARAAAADARVTQLQQLVETRDRDTGQTVQRLTAEALTSAARAERLANVLAASDVRVYPMRGQRTAAAAAGQVLFSPSRGIALTASNVPPTPSDQVHQVWLTTTRGAISLGFVSPDAQGRIATAIEAPPELPGSVIGFMLSLEPTGGNLKPTGPIVLTS